MAKYVPSAAKNYRECYGSLEGNDVGDCLNRNKKIQQLVY
jgi:hypothetical protein